MILAMNGKNKKKKRSSHPAFPNLTSFPSAPHFLFAHITVDVFCDKEKHQEKIKRKGRGTKDQIVNICWIIDKARELKKIYFCFIDYAKAFDCVDYNKLWKILNEMRIPDNMTYLLRNLYVG